MLIISPRPESVESYSGFWKCSGVSKIFKYFSNVHLQLINIKSFTGFEPENIKNIKPSLSALKIGIVSSPESGKYLNERKQKVL